MKYKRLYAEMFVKGVTNKEVATLLNKSVSAIGSRLRGQTAFTWNEAIAIMNTYFKDYPLEYIFSMGEYENEAGNYKVKR